MEAIEGAHSNWNFACIKYCRRRDLSTARSDSARVGLLSRRRCVGVGRIIWMAECVRTNLLYLSSRGIRHCSLALE